MISQRIRRQLESLDWDFPDRLPGTSEAIHWYPGTFPSSLPATLAEAVSLPGDLIFDPYSGIGTTATEALRLGRSAWVAEQNPIACLASYVAAGMVILRQFHPNWNRIIDELLLILAERYSLIPETIIFSGTHERPAADGILGGLMNPSPGKINEFFFAREPNWASLSVWVKGETLDQIKGILAACTEDRLGFFGHLTALAMLSAILRSASSQVKSWGHIADNVRPKDLVRKNVFDLSRRWLQRTQRMIQNISTVAIQQSSVATALYTLSMHNWRSNYELATRPNSSPKCLITSPPYGDAIDYILSQRLSLYLIGYTDQEITELVNSEIGARRKRFSKSSKGAWASEIGESLDTQIGYLDTPSIIALVLPHADALRDAGRIEIEKVLEAREFEMLFEKDRSIRQLKTRQSWTSIKKETILIFGRQM